MTAYKWQAQYNDGTTLNQIDDNGEKHGYNDIDRSKLKAFALFDDMYEIEGSKPVLYIVFDDGDGDKLVWTRRTFQRLGAPEPVVFHIVGKKGQYIMALANDGQIIVRDNFVDDGLFDEVLG